VPYPLLLDLSARLVVIVGGGAVGARKARGLLDAGASRIRVVAPTFADAMPAEVERRARPYQPQDLDGATLVFAATDRLDVNAAVVRDAHARGLLVNRADAAGEDEAPGDFTTPAMLRDGDLLITVSGGGSPALAAAVRDALRDRLDPRWARMAAAMQSFRPRILASGVTIETRRCAFRDLATDEAMDILERLGPDEVWAWLRKRNPGV
jgi:precorrin-2 dehydrogenase/sirohydrochlorin ferrochelatase